MAPTTTEPIVKAGGDPVLTFDPTPPPRTEPLPPAIPAIPDPVFITATIDPAAMPRFQPDYPPELIRADIEGTATVRVLIGVDGRVKSVELVSAAHPGFFEATRRQALRYWKFKPATRDGIAVESWRTMTVRFNIQG
ncbi:energy transducer TonB [Rhizorhabdus dicambivorans]|uniref:energy transducer TonB n=1 Tax=Rhizorhabdus dicambivorans TaxID=1850238 RepID=UPI001EE0BE55|nr:energy transducer TonB [Rhizorhabdus dicambivorans]